MPDFQTAIFDLDGTLIDSLWVWNKIDADFLARRGIAVPVDYAREICSKSFRESAEYTAARFGLNESTEEIMAEWSRMAEEEYGRNVPLKPHAREYLLFLEQKGIPLGIATSLPERLYEPVLEHNGIFRLFDAIASVDEVGKGKDSPDVYLLAAKKLGAAPSACAVFEDLLAGVRAAASAGMHPYGVYDADSAKDEAEIRALAERYVFDFSELL